jgi:hypothetical protein
MKHQTHALALAFSLTLSLSSGFGCAVRAAEPQEKTAAAAAAAAKAVYAADLGALPAFRVAFKGTSATGEKTGDFSPPWSGNLWDADSTGEIGAKAGEGVTLTTLTGKGAAQFYDWQPLADLPAGRRYAATVEYRTPGGDGAGRFAVRGEGVAEKAADLGATGGAWKTARIEWEQAGAPGKLSVLVQNYGMGRGAALTVRSLKVEDVGAAEKPAGDVPATAENATSALPPLDPAAVGNAYVRGIVEQVKGLKPRLVLLDPDPDAALRRFSFNSLDEGKATCEPVSVEGMPFKTALRVATDKKKAEWQTHLQSFNRGEKVRKGDVLYVTAYVRALKVTDGKAEGGGRIYIDERTGPNKDATGIYNGDFAIPRRWTRIHLPMVAERDLGPDDELKLMFTFGQSAQTVEFGGVTVLNFGPGVDKKALPHAELPLDYAGREPGAAWRRAALARIEKVRKAPLKVVVTDAQGRPVPGAKVSVEMTRNEFVFGSSLPTGMLPGTNVKPWNADFQRTAGAPQADKERLQKEFLRLFNAATTSVTWTLWEGGDARISRDDILAGLKWLHANGIPCYDSQVVYPGPEFTPEKYRALMKKETAAEFAAGIDSYIDFCARELPVDSLQIANEIEGRPQYTDVLGVDAVPGWFKRAKAANPKKPVMVNGPYGLGGGVVSMQGRGAAYPRSSEGLQFYYDLIAWLEKRGAPIDYVGFQNHAGIGAPAPADVLKTLDQFATLGRPIRVTEFEVTLQDGSDPKQRAYQADYVRDFLIAVYSHPAVEGVMLQDFWQPGAWQYEGASCFFNADWSLNPHGKEYERLVLHDWRTQASGKADPKGGYAVRGFRGDYRVTVTGPDGRTRTVTARLPKAGATVRVSLPAQQTANRR